MNANSYIFKNNATFNRCEETIYVPTKLLRKSDLTQVFTKNFVALLRPVVFA